MSPRVSVAAVRRLALLGLVGGAALVAPGSAVAAPAPLFCVNATSCPEGGIETSLPAALSMAAAGGDPTKVFVGPKPDGTPYVGPFAYPSSTGANIVEIIGQDRPVLTSSTAGKAVLELHGPARSVVHGVDVVVPALPGADGLLLDDANAEDVVVRGGGSTSLNRALRVRGQAEVGKASIAMKSGFAVEADAGSISFFDSTVRAPFGIIAADADVALFDTRLNTEHAAVQAIRGHGGIDSLRGDGVTIRSSELTTSAPDGVGLFARDASVEVIRGTIAGLSSVPDADTAGLKLETRDRDAKYTIASTVAAGYDRQLVRTVGAGRTAPLRVFDSEWSASRDIVGPTAGEAVTKENVVDAAPRFVSRTGADLRLRGGDAAIDADSKPGNAVTSSDIDGVNLVDGDGDGVASSDAGAHEYGRRAPSIDALDAPSSAAAGAPVAFAARVSDRDGESVAVRWELGDGASASGGGVSHAYARPGTYTGSVVARDEAGVETRRAFTVTVAPPASGGVAPSGGGGADTTAPVLRSVRLKRRGGKLRLSVNVSEKATLRVRVLKRSSRRRVATTKLAVKAGRSTRRLKVSRRHARALARRREVLSIVAIDAAGNRSKARTVRITRTRR